MDRIPADRRDRKTKLISQLLKGAQILKVALRPQQRHDLSENEQRRGLRVGFLPGSGDGPAQPQTQLLQVESGALHTAGQNFVRVNLRIPALGSQGQKISAAPSQPLRQSAPVRGRRHDYGCSTALERRQGHITQGAHQELFVQIEEGRVHKWLALTAEGRGRSHQEPFPAVEACATASLETWTDPTNTPPRLPWKFTLILTRPAPTNMRRSVWALRDYVCTPALRLKHFCLHSSTRDGFERYRCQRQVTRVAYTFSVFNTFAKWGLSLLLLTTSVFAQVRILVPKQHYQQQEQISAKLENQTSQPITVCVQFGQWSPKGNTIESTPSPFFVERNDNGKWGVLLNGPDVGSNSQPVEVDSGKSMEFPFRLNGEGTMRLRLDYWIGFKPDMKCSGPSKGTKHLRSATFTLG